MGKLAKDDQEDDQARDPGIALITMHNLVTEKGNKEGCCSYDQNAGPAGHVAVHSIEQLGSHNDIDGRPTETGKDVKNGDYFSVSFCFPISFCRINMTIALKSEIKDGIQCVDINSASALAEIYPEIVHKKRSYIA
jgi:hypothetical protein